MAMDDKGGIDPLHFELYDKVCNELHLTCQAPTEEIKQNWITQIRSILDMQGDFLRGW